MGFKVLSKCSNLEALLDEFQFWSGGGGENFEILKSIIETQMWKLTRSPSPHEVAEGRMLKKVLTK